MIVTGVIFYLFILLSGTGGEMCVSRAMKTIGEVTDFRPHSIARVIGRAMKVPWMWIGVALMALGFFSLMGLLSIANVSFVYPASALSYVVGALGGKFFLGERVTKQRWAGVLLVTLGVLLVVVGRG
ncbi:MAG: EamA family transporter [Candidatus Acidiferrales bacterium]